VEERPHEGAGRHTEPTLVEAYEAHHVAYWGAGSRWSDSGALHSGWVRLVFGRKSPSRTSSSSLLSVTEELAQASAGRSWLLPAIVVGRLRRREKATAALDGG
jgi:hypothetical protein